MARERQRLVERRLEQRNKQLQQYTEEKQQVGLPRFTHTEREREREREIHIES